MSMMHEPSEWYHSDGFYDMCEQCKTDSEENCAACFVNKTEIIGMYFKIFGYNPCISYKDIVRECESQI